MSSTNRTIEINGADVGFAQLLENMKQQGRDMYGDFDKQAKQYSNNLEDQHRKIEGLIRAQREKLNMMREEQRMSAQMQLEERLRNAHDLQGMNQAKEQHKESIREIDESYRKSSFVVGQAATHNTAPERGSSGGGGSGGGGASNIGGRGIGTAKAIVAGMGGGLMVGGINEMLMSMFREGAELETATLGLSAMSGRSVGSPGLGLKTATAANLAKATAQQRGIAGSDFEQAATGQMMTEKAFGLGFGQLGEVNTFARQGGEDVMALTRRMLGMAAKSKIWEIDKGDFSSLGEKMGFVVDLMSEEKQTRESGITGARAIGMLGAFGKYGGSLSDDRAMGVIGGLGGGIQSPTNDYVKAEMMRSILGGNAERGNELDLLGVRSLMAQGMAGENVFSDVLGGMQERFGSGTRMTQTALSIAFPELMKNPELLEKISGMNALDFTEENYEEMGGDAGSFNIKARAHGKTGRVESNQARLQDAMAKTGIQLIDSLSGMVEMLISGFEKLPGVVKETTEVIKEFGSFIKEIIDNPRETISNEWSDHRKTQKIASSTLGWAFDKMMGTDQKNVSTMLFGDEQMGGVRVKAHNTVLNKFDSYTKEQKDYAVMQELERQGASPGSVVDLEGGGTFKFSADLKKPQVSGSTEELINALNKNTKAVSSSTTGWDYMWNKVKQNGKSGR